MAREISAGLLAYQVQPIRVFLVKPGGPYFSRREKGIWGIPKGRLDGQQTLEAAKREFEEETGVNPDTVRCTDYTFLGNITYRSGKIVYAYAFKSHIFHFIRSNTFRIEYPPRSGRIQEYPEVAEGRWFTVDAAREYMHPAQQVFLNRLEAWLRDHPEHTTQCRCNEKD